ncbi:DNA polymerase III subunit gamma/tau [Kingella oralis]
MTYQVLARKWRPKTFADLVGQQYVVKALQNALANGRLHHAYLLTGTRGVGKTTIARILAKSLNCENAQHGEPCGQCATCQAIDAGRFVDLLEIDAASNTGIDNIREVLENAQYAPTAGKYKVYIIDEVHMLSKSAFNAMLKTLEEPPEHVKFILATTDPHKVPITVLSRCLQFVLRNMTAQQVSDHLAHVLNEEHIAYDPAALALLGRAAQGSMRDALSLLDQAIAMGSGSVQEADVRHMIGAVDNRYLFELLEILSQKNGAALIAKASEMHSQSLGFDSVLSELALLLQRIALLQTVPAAIAADDPEHDRLHALARAFNSEQTQLYYQCALHGKQDLPLAPDEYAGFVMTLLRMLAFAPFAAEDVPANAVIENTQMHEPAAPPIGSLKSVGVNEAQSCVIQARENHADATEAVEPPAVTSTASSTVTTTVAPASQPAAEIAPTAQTVSGSLKNAGVDEAQPNAAQANENHADATEAVEPQAVVPTVTPTVAPASQPATEIAPAAQTFSGSLKTDAAGLATTLGTALEPTPTVETANETNANASANMGDTISEANADKATNSAPHSNETTAPEPQATHSVPANERIAAKAETTPATPASPVGSLKTVATHASEAHAATVSGSLKTNEAPFSAAQPAPKKSTSKKTTSRVAQTNHSGSLKTETLNETQPEAHTPYPPFAAENWAAIAERISNQISAARMLLDHTAWVAYQDGELHLAIVSEKTKNTTKKEYFNRIASALSEAYQLPIHIQTQPFAEGNGWETPAMHRSRIAAENRAQAQALMEQDPAVQAIQQHFGATWDAESIALNA